MKIVAIISSFFLSGCIAVAASAVNFAARTSDYEKIADLSYGGEPRQKLDIYLPKDKGAGPHPVIVFFYGGSWKTGTKSEFLFAAEPFTSQGYIVVVPDYGKYPDYRYPTFAEDGAKAVSWTKDHIAKHGGDASRLFVAGHSAGAHIGALIATDPRYLKAQGKSRDIIRGFAGLAGPYDFVPTDPDIVKIFAAAGGNAKTAMPATYIDGKQPPMLLLYGLEDDVVWPGNIESMQQQVKQHGGDLTVKTYPGIGHIGIISALSKPGRNKAPVVADMVKFFSSH